MESACWFSWSDAYEQNENIPPWTSWAISYLLGLILCLGLLLLGLFWSRLWVWSSAESIEFSASPCCPQSCWVAVCRNPKAIWPNQKIMQKSTETTMSRKWQHWQGQRATNILRHAKRDSNATHELLIQQHRMGRKIRPSWVNRKPKGETSAVKQGQQIKTGLWNRKRLALH